MSPGSNADKDEKREDRSGFRALREYSPYLTLGFQLAAAVVVFFLIGAWLDERWETSPWLKLAGLFLGSVGGFIKFFRSIAELDRQQNTKSREH